MRSSLAMRLILVAGCQGIEEVVLRPQWREPLRVEP